MFRVEIMHSRVGLLYPVYHTSEAELLRLLLAPLLGRTNMIHGSGVWFDLRSEKT